MRDIIPPTDTRLRKDQKLLENGKLDLADQEKARLEELQRNQRKKREENKEVWKPIFFEEMNEQLPNGENLKIFRPLDGDQNYWHRRQIKNWEGLESIF